MYVCCRVSDGVHLSLAHHYRGSKMALWLELIPKLHKSDHLDARYHQLDDWDNVTSFEAEGTRLTARSDLLTTSTSARPTPTPPRTLADLTWSSPTTTTTTSTTPTLSTTTTLAAVGGVELPSGSTYDGHQQGVDSLLSSDVNTVSLSITIAVGSFLLFVNILVFVAVYYQKDRIRRERRRHKADLRAAATHCRHDDVDGIVARTDSLSSDVRSNLSLPYGYTSTEMVDYAPTRSVRSNYNHARHQTLPRLSSPPGTAVDAPAYGTVRGRPVPRWSTTSDQVDTTTTTGGLHTYSECIGHNGGLGQKCPAVSTHYSSSDTNSPLTTVDDSHKPSTIV